SGRSRGALREEEESAIRNARWLFAVAVGPPVYGGGADWFRWCGAGHRRGLPGDGVVERRGAAADPEVGGGERVRTGVGLPGGVLADQPGRQPAGGAEGGAGADARHDPLLPRVGRDRVSGSRDA